MGASEPQRRSPGDGAPEVTFQPISVVTDGGGQEGRLLLADGQLVAVFVRVSAEETAGGEQKDGWFLEAGFGPCGDLLTVPPPLFASLEDAAAWARIRLQGNPLFG